MLEEVEKGGGVEGRERGGEERGRRCGRERRRAGGEGGVGRAGSGRRG